MRIPRRFPAADGEQGVALITVVVAMLVLSALSLLTLGAIMSQMSPVQYQTKANLTINAARGGMDAALAAIRKATYVEAGAIYGDRSKLPCWTSQAGTLEAPITRATVSYAVTIRYFKSDPTQQSADWRDKNALPCATGVGTLITPAFAQVTSSATGAALANLPASSGDRTLQGTYTFSLTNPQLPGGLIKDPQGLCYTGGLLLGAGVTVGTCAPGADEQMWIYTLNYQLALAATRAADGTGGLCLGASSTTGATAMRVCDSTDHGQRWGVSGSNPVHLFGHLAGAFNKTWCLGPATTGSAGSPAVASTGTCNDAARGVYPQASVGAGAAGTLLKQPEELHRKPFQWVNYQEFGRCMDINGWKVTASIHIVYPCKQDPMATSTTAASPGWNEVFTWDMNTKYFYANVNSASSKPSDPNDPAYCMKSPNKVGGYIGFSTPCTSVTAATAAPYQWTLYRDTGSYATSYTLVDSYGRCLANGPATGSYSSLITSDCDGSDGQKWNAPAGFVPSDLASILEVRPSSS